MVELAAPWWLLLLPLPVLLWWFQRRRPSRQDSAGALLHPMASILGQLQGRSIRTAVVPWLWLIGCTLLIIALARPQWLDADPDGAPGHNLVFAIDVSGSMRTLDYSAGGKPVSRLEMLKSSLIHFLEQASRLRAGIVIFADDAMTFMPLTSDLAVAARIVAEIDDGLAGERTALGDAIALSLRRMQAVPEEHAARILVLLTDGVPTAGTITPGAAAALASAAGIRIYTAGIGSDQPAMFPLSPTERPMLAENPLDEELLRDLATSTGGAYFRISETTDLAEVLAQIEQIEKSRIPVPATVHDWYWLPALAGLMLLVVAETRKHRERLA